VTQKYTVISIPVPYLLFITDNICDYNAIESVYLFVACMFVAQSSGPIG